VFVNGHGGNIEALAEVARRFSGDPAHDGYGVAFTWFEAVGEHAGDMGHAGPLETALLRATNPDLVREDRVDDARDGGADRWGEWVSGVNLAHDSDEFTDNGVVGDPTAGDAARGRELLDRASDALAELARAVADRDLENDG
jgi:creatinine amidohydrolase